MIKYVLYGAFGGFLYGCGVVTWQWLRRRFGLFEPKPPTVVGTVDSIQSDEWGITVTGTITDPNLLVILKKYQEIDFNQVAWHVDSNLFEEKA